MSFLRKCGREHQLFPANMIVLVLFLSQEVALIVNECFEEK